MPGVATTAKTIAEAASISIDVVRTLVDNASVLKHLFAGAVSMPAEAEKAIEEILEEVEKSLDAVDAATREFLAAVKDPALFLDDMGRVHEMSSSHLPKLVESNRGHCDRIRELDSLYLSGWLDSFFPGSQERRDEARDIMNALDDADRDLFSFLDVAAEKMRDTAREAYRLELTGQRSEAEALLRDAGLTMLDMRDAFNDASVRMAELKREFVKARRSHSV